jgi:hypothetical protein
MSGRKCSRVQGQVEKCNAGVIFWQRALLFHGALGLQCVRSKKMQCSSRAGLELHMQYLKVRYQGYWQFCFADFMFCHRRFRFAVRRSKVMQDCNAKVCRFRFLHTMLYASFALLFLQVEAGKSGGGSGDMELGAWGHKWPVRPHFAIIYACCNKLNASISQI